MLKVSNNSLKKLVDLNDYGKIGSWVTNKGIHSELCLLKFFLIPAWFFEFLILDHLLMTLRFPLQSPGGTYSVTLWKNIAVKKMHLD